MDSKKVIEKDGKVRRFNGAIVLETRFLASDYRMCQFPHGVTGSTGLLRAAEFVPEKSDLPAFLVRWDENKEVVDVDISHVSEGERIKFINQTDGYCGHHPIRVSDSDKRRVFQLDIQIPSKVIFQGKMLVPVYRELEL